MRLYLPLIVTGFFAAGLHTSAFADGEYIFKDRVYKLAPYSDNFEAADDTTFLQEKSDDKADLTEQQSSVKDQGSRGSCAFFAATALVENAIRRQFNFEKELNLSEEYLIYYAKGVLGVNPLDDGSTVSSNLTTYERGGFLLEEDMPYTHSWFNEGMPCENEDEDTTRKVECFAHKAPSAEQLEKLVPASEIDLQRDGYFGGNKLQWIMNKLNEGIPVAVGLPTHQDGWNGETGYAEYTLSMKRECDAGSKKCGGHAIVLVGFDRSVNLFVFKNSWGGDWGNNGYGTMPFEYVNRYTNYGSINTTDSIEVPSDLLNVSPEITVENVSCEIVKGHVQDGEEGVLIKMSFDYKAPLGSFYYISLFPQIKDESGEYQPISFTVNGQEQYIAARFYTIAWTTEDLVRTPENPLELFLPYSQFDAANLAEETQMWLRPSIYKMSDSESYAVLFREFLDFER